MHEPLLTSEVAVDGATLELLPVGVALLDRNGEADWVNTRAAELLFDASTGWAKEIVEQVAGGAIVREQRVHLAGSDVTVEVSAVPVAAPAGDTLVIFTDLSARERHERSERNFVTNAAHQIRTPITSIFGALAALRAGAIDDPDHRERFLNHLEAALHRLTNVVEALLMLGRVQSGGTIDRRVIPLEPLIGRVVRNRANIRVRCERGLAAVAEERLLLEAVSNVVDNAQRHGGDEPIDVVCASRGSRARIEVRDRGRGIPPEQRSELLERFRAEGTSSGIGLAIANEALSVLDGSLTLADAVGGGLVVTFDLPGARLL